MTANNKFILFNQVAEARIVARPKVTRPRTVKFFNDRVPEDLRILCVLCGLCVKFFSHAKFAKFAKEDAKEERVRVCRAPNRNALASQPFYPEHP